MALEITLSYCDFTVTAVKKYSDIISILVESPLVFIAIDTEQLDPANTDDEAVLPRVLFA